MPGCVEMKTGCSWCGLVFVRTLGHSRVLVRLNGKERGEGRLKGAAMSRQRVSTCVEENCFIDCRLRMC